MAHIIQFTNPAPGPVQQRRGPGRNPKMVVNLRRFRSDKEFQQKKVIWAREAIEKIQLRAAIYEGEWHAAKYAAAVAMQQAAKDMS